MTNLAIKVLSGYHITNITNMSIHMLIHFKMHGCLCQKASKVLNYNNFIHNIPFLHKNPSFNGQNNCNLKAASHKTTVSNK